MRPVQLIHLSLCEHRWLPSLAYYEWCCYEHENINTSQDTSLNSVGHTPWNEIVESYFNPILIFWGAAIQFSIATAPCLHSYHNHSNIASPSTALAFWSDDSCDILVHARWCLIETLTSSAQNFFMRLMNVCVSSLENHFFKPVIHFSIWAVCSHRIVGFFVTPVPHQPGDVQESSPFLWLAFSL